MLQPTFGSGLIEAGVDEAGRGCLAGPVVAAAVIFPEGYTHPALNDSKKLSATKREAFAEIIKKDALSYGIGMASVEEIDRINILQAAFLAMHRAIAELTPLPELLLIDGNRFRQYQQIPHKCVIKGDATYLTIAAASILAKTHRDAYMAQLAEEFPTYGWERNAGYPTRAHRAAIEKYGATLHHRRSFQLLAKRTTIFP